ncbi:ABC transporter ATP-binding protein [Ahniella affigens]|uniref:ABC transporter ATP-binding protein n=1 Tax=Ahniella affigens TaxID=2021234 RepID=A0A2P1PTI7_9GAMM|nr:ABC transporter ATP-binding protein [Ahniella affigens]AVP98156.1 ABC transporter ATP-binding protein [Ahniella affigens]
MSQPLLEAQGIRKSYDGKPVLDGLDLCIMPGALVGLIGRNGAGKSTLLNLAAGLLVPDAGSIRLQGMPPSEATDAVLAELAYVGQNKFTLSDLSAQHYLDFVGSYYPNYRPDVAQSMLKRFEVPGNRAMLSLSPGVRQRIEIVRALSVQPKLMLLDEPLSSVDPVGRRQIISEVLSFAQSHGAAVLLTTHLLNDIERASAEVAVLHRGRIIARDPVRELKARFIRLESSAAERPPFLVHAQFVHPTPEGGWVALLRRKDLPLNLPESIRPLEPVLEELFLDTLP